MISGRRGTQCLCGDQLQHTVAPQFAFKPRHQAEEVLFIWRSLIEKSVEWNLPIFGLDGDVFNAYDSTCHSLCFCLEIERSARRDNSCLVCGRCGVSARKANLMQILSLRVFFAVALSSREIQQLLQFSIAAWIL